MYFVPCTLRSTPAYTVALGSPAPPSMYNASTLSASPVTPAGLTQHYYPPHPMTPQPIYNGHHFSRPISAQGTMAHPTPPMLGYYSYYQMMWGMQYVLFMIQSHLHCRLPQSRPHPAPAENFDQNASV